MLVRARDTLLDKRLRSQYYIWGIWTDLGNYGVYSSSQVYDPTGVMDVRGQHVVRTASIDQVFLELTQHINLRIRYADHVFDRPFGSPGAQLTREAVIRFLTGLN